MHLVCVKCRSGEEKHIQTMESGRDGDGEGRVAKRLNAVPGTDDGIVVCKREDDRTWSLCAKLLTFTIRTFGRH